MSGAVGEQRAGARDPRRSKTAAPVQRVVQASTEIRRLLTESDGVVGRLVGDARQAAGLPQSHAARHLGWPQSRLANIELGKRRLLFVEALLLADLYAVPVSSFDPRVATPEPRHGRRPRTDVPRKRTAR